MKKLYAVFTTFFMGLILATAAQAATFEEGKHYVKVKGVPSKGNEVTEYLSFYCPACFRQEGVMKDIAASLPSGVKFSKSHVSGLPGRDVNLEKALTTALVAAKKLGKDKEIIEKVFQQIHIKRDLFKTPEDIATLFEQNGIPKTKFAQAMKSFAVNMQAKTMMKNNETLKSQGITGVPSLVVNGKYKALTKDIKSVEQYKALIQYLLTLPA